MGLTTYPGNGSSGRHWDPDFEAFLAAPYRDGPRTNLSVIYSLARNFTSTSKTSVNPDDLAQETLIKVLRFYTTYRPRNGIDRMAWVCTIMKNQFRDMVRKSKQEISLDEERENNRDYSELIPDLHQDHDPEAYAVAGEMIREISHV